MNPEKRDIFVRRAKIWARKK